MTTEEVQEQSSDETAKSAPTTRSTPRKRAKPSAKSSAKASGDEAPKKRATSTRKKASGTQSSRAGGTRRATSRKAAAEQPAEQPAEQSAEPATVQAKTPPRMLSRYREDVAPALTSEFSYTSAMQVPRLNKITLNIGLGEAETNAKAIENATRDLEMITGQHPVTTKARKSVAGFKVREGMVVGITVTLRGRRMYEFFDRLVSSALPRIRDFRGLSRESFDGRGNYSMGIREQVIFPEIDYNSIDRIRSLQLAIVTSAFTDREGLRLLDLMGMPFTRTAADEVAA